MDDRQKDPQVGSERTFVGRERELAELRTGLADVTSGRGRVGGMFLISGEAGIGKTRLADELAREAESRGMRVVWGRCWEGGGAPAYWPWIQVIRGCLNSSDLDERRSLLESEHASSMIETVAQIVPELHALAPRPLKPAMAPRLDAEQAQFRLFDSVATLLKDFARGQPLLVLLDDLHDADYSSLMMMLLLAQGLAGTGILIVGTYRDVGVRRSPELSKHIGDLSREARSFSLAGLSPSEVAQFVELRSRQKPDDKLISRLHAATAGNPLFVDGVVRTLMGDRNAGPQTASNDDFKIPDNVREAIRRRLAMLSDEAHSLLKVAAAIGNEFEADLCLRVGEVSRDEFNLRLDEATTSGITISLGNSRCRFAHALVRAAVYDALDTNTRIRMHGRIAEAIEEIHAKDLRAHLAELAHHFHEAGGSRDIGKAISYSIRAGDQAREVFANEEALSHWGAALKLIEEFGGDRRDCAGLHRRMSRLVSGMGQHARSIEHSAKALQIFEELDDVREAAEIHLILGNQLSLSLAGRAQDLPRAADHLRKAQTVFSQGPENSGLAEVHFFVGQLAYRRLCVRDAAVALRLSMELAERVGDANVWALSTSGLASALMQTGKVGEALEGLARVWSKLDYLNRPSYAFAASWLAGSSFISLWDPRGAQRWWATELAKSRLGSDQRELLTRNLQKAHLLAGDLPTARSLLKETPNPDAAGVLAFYEGEWEQADSILEQCFELARSYSPQKMLICSHELAGARRIRGESVQGQTLPNEMLALYPDEEPHRQVEMVLRPELALINVGMGALEDAAAHISRCREISAGEDWRGLGGHLDHAEGVLAAAQGRDFATHFEKSIATFKQYCLPWAEADTLHHWGLALNAAGEHAQANDKFDAAIDIYRRHGAGQRWIDRVEAARPSVAAATTQKPAEDSSGSAIFTKEGDFWTITHGRNTFRLRHFKGLTYIAYLLAHPGVRIHVIDLVAMVEGGATRAPAAALAQARADGLEAKLDLGDAGEALDSQAIAEYRTRLAEVREEIAEAETNNDPGALDRARYEFDLLSSQLTAGVGRSGRARRSSSHVERARAQVTKSIRQSVAHIRRNDVKLGDHFATSIRTGAFCAYLPNLADLENNPS